MKESIVLYARQLSAIKRLTDTQKARLFEALLVYAGGEEPTFTDDVVMIAFDFFRAQIDADTQKYIETCEKRREAGSKGGKQKQANVANATKCKQMLPNDSKRGKPYHNDNDNDNENDKDKDLKEKELLCSSKKKEQQQFNKPTLQEVADYCYSMGYTFSPEAFHAYYESNGWKVGRNQMKNWKAACVTWQKKESDYETRTTTRNDINRSSAEERANEAASIVARLLAEDEANDYHRA